ncbi:MAG: DUF1223 domain-containing protein [Alphaproteobacteria bacterium]
MKWVFLVAALCVATMAGSLARAQTAPERRPVVMELYTSQGCFACPRANRLVAEFARDPDVIALTFPVGYWDYLGWSDTFAQPQFSNRQRDFERAMQFRSPFTPQLIIGGIRQVSAGDWDEARATLDEVRAMAPRAGAPRVSITRIDRGIGHITISGETLRSTPADVWFIGYDPGPVSVWVERGENANRTVVHYNIVRWIERAGTWDGGAMTLDRPRCQPQCVVIVQEPNGGPILAAAATRRQSLNHD